MSLPRIKYLEELAHKLGFTLSGAEDYVGEQFGDVLTLYNKDVEVFVGSMHDLERWLQGFQFARTYDSLHLITNSKPQGQENEFRY